MATANCILSLTFEDEKKERVSMPLYINLSDAVTLAELVTGVKAIAGHFEAISASQLIRNRLIVEMSLPAGIKSAPTAGADNEETGLFTMSLTTPSFKSFSVDVPAISEDVMEAANPNIIDLEDAAVDTVVTDLTAGAITNNLWTTPLNEVRSALKTFRTHRRAAKRAR
jgi:hypothetical protein